MVFSFPERNQSLSLLVLKVSKAQVGVWVNQYGCVDDYGSIERRTSFRRARGHHRTLYEGHDKQGKKLERILIWEGKLSMRELTAVVCNR
jgi:hypothetical protein